ncbi:MAG: 50S ribosomal protein L9 [Thermodesulfobacteriota bacterium]|nr:50S ribosomal protein L9 [Deltaproteobacteria bacterium TMED58]RZP16554.1 MAG: 50S ribosomal protein L9 [Candidatus Dadabacteria bacterium]|tara:strand:+ start:275 stop:715 length:441 start_codon:yes stop_codon:yes gene_type:complete
MKIILTQDVKKLGKKGDIIEVKDGQARNHLIPNNFAVEANKKNLNELDAKNESVKKNDLQNKQVALDICKKLEKEKIIFKVKENSGKLFGSITTLAIYEELSKLGYKIDKRNIYLKRPINTLGKFEIKIKLYNEIFTNISIEIISN